MKSLKIAVCVIMLLIAACRDPNTNKNSPPPPPGNGPVIADNGLSGADREAFYHIAEGSELYPYSWMKALYTTNNQPFLNNPERFGLIPDTDPNNKYGLPIGLTTAVRRGVPFAEMVGVNCAACHVGELTYKGTSFRIDGTQNLFSLGAFYGELIQASVATVEDPARLWEFLVRWWNEGDKGATPAAATSRAAGRDTSTTYHLPSPTVPSDKTRQMLERYRTLEELRNAGELEGAFVDDLRELGVRIKAAHDRQNPTQADQQAPDDKPDVLKNVAELKAKILARKRPSPTGVFASSREGTERETHVSEVLGDIGEYIRLFRSYIDFLKALGKASAGGTDGSFGRVDAFGGARNLLFGKENPPLPATAPVSYPYLWNFANFAYFHYMANTNSILQRNIGQALGLGATFEPETFGTTVDIGNTNTLEQLAHKITAPAWPTKILGEVNAQSAERGKAIYEQQCANCHEQFQVVNGLWELNTYPVDRLGTDPNEAKNFCVPLTFEGKVTNFPTAAGILLPRIEQRYYKDFNIPESEQIAWNQGRLPVQWRCIQEYSARPMAGVWATAPYLHNGSVLTLYDLLLPAAQRPTKFFVGTREYDPQKLGYVNQRDPLRSFEFDTSKPGNSNAGHEYGVNLSEAEKMDLLEYLKILKPPS